MTSFRQIEANRRNALKSTGPVTAEGKQRSRCNAVRHGLTAETVIGALEDAEDYQAFEAAVTADYDTQSAVERELVLRLASLLWRLRRATTMETGLFEIQAQQLLELWRCAHHSDRADRDRDRQHADTAYGTENWPVHANSASGWIPVEKQGPGEQRGPGSGPCFGLPPIGGFRGLAGSKLRPLAAPLATCRPQI
jgi:hypothetical protein